MAVAAAATDKPVDAVGDGRREREIRGCAGNPPPGRAPSAAIWRHPAGVLRGADNLAAARWLPLPIR
jgi:hypothetical protein